MNSGEPHDPNSQPPVSPPDARPGIRATGVLTVEEAINALRAVNLWSPWLTPGLLFFVLVCYLIAAAVMLPSLVGIVQAVASGLLLLLVAWIFLGSNHPYRVYVKKWNEDPELQQPIAWSLSDEGVLIESLHTRLLYRWPAFESQVTTFAEIVLLHRGMAYIRLIPKRCFGSDADWQAACQLVAAKVNLRASVSGAVVRSAQATPISQA